MALDATTVRLLLELRDETAQELLFQEIDLNEGTLGQAFSIEEADWWTTLHSVADPFVFLEKYSDQQDPSAKELLIVDRSRHETRVVPQFQLSYTDAGYLVGSDPKDSSRISRVDLPIGRRDAAVAVSYPVYFAPGTESYATVAGFLELADRELGCEYYENRDYIIICYYERFGTKFVRKLLVLKGGEEFYSGPLDVNLEGFASGGFMMVNHLLVFIENGNQINAIQL